MTPPASLGGSQEPGDRSSYCFYFVARVQGSRSAEERPDNGDMSSPPEKQTIRTVTGHTPRVLAVLPDLSAYRTASGETPPSLQKPRNTSKAPLEVQLKKTGNHPRQFNARAKQSVRRRRMGQVVIACLSVCLALLIIFTWTYISKTRALPTESPLQNSYMTRFAMPPEHTATLPAPTPVRP